jgi:hypothetical protein
MKSLLTKKIQFEKENSKIRCLRTQLDFVERLIEFMKGLIARKNYFKLNLSFNWKKLNFEGRIIIFKS